MKKLIAAAVLMFAALTASAYVQCMTNMVITVNDPNMSWITVSGSTNYQSGQNYADVVGMDLVSQDCNNGTVITISTYGCSNNDTQVGMVSWSCQPSWCGFGFCSDGNAWPITMPGGCCSITFRIYQFGCCSLMKCDTMAITRCNISGD